MYYYSQGIWVRIEIDLIMTFLPFFALMKRVFSLYPKIVSSTYSQPRWYKIEHTDVVFFYILVRDKKKMHGTGIFVR
jgi:hypothetical protein